MATEEKIKNEAFKKMAAVCSRSEQCSPDIRKKLIAFGLNEAETDEVIGKLKSEKFIDDERFAKAYVAEKFRLNKWGRVKIRYYLKAKGLNDQIIETGLDNLDEEKYKAALLETMKEKARKVKKKSKYEKMAQIIRFAQSRGYEPELIHRHMNEVLE